MWIPSDLPGEHDLLLVPARQRGGARARPSTADVELPEQLARPLDDPPRVEPAVARVRLPLVVVEHEVLGEREVEHEAATLAVLGDVTDAVVERLAWGPVLAQGRAGHDDGAAL